MVFKVLVVDDSTFYRRRVKEILDGDRELEVVGEARNGRDALEKAEALKPDVITMDVEMPVMDGSCKGHNGQTAYTYSYVFFAYASWCASNIRCVRSGRARFLT